MCFGYVRSLTMISTVVRKSSTSVYCICIGVETEFDLCEAQTEVIHQSAPARFIHSRASMKTQKSTI